MNDFISLPGVGASTDIKVQGLITTPDTIITVSEDGVIKTYNNLGYAMVLVTAVDEQGLKHTLNFIVEVTTAEYL